jgi:hypothetical protein
MLGRSRDVMRRLRPPPPAPPPAATERRRERGTPPNVVGQPPLLSAPGLDLAVVVIVRDEAPYLEEWLAYHHALGVQHVFLYDNGSRDALHEVIEPWVNHGLVTLLHWPLPGGQIDAYSHALRFFGPSVEWLAFFDVDEFLVPLVDDDLPALLARWPDAADVRVPRVDFGFSGHRSPPAGLTIEAYTGVADVFGRDPAKPPRVKTIARARCISAVGIHTASVADVPEAADGSAVPHATVGPRACAALVQLNHYYTRSFDEFEAKRVRGSATGRIDRPAIPFELPTLRTDENALRFADRTRAEIERMRSLAPSPYRYGSQLQVERFPRFNDLGLFAEFAFANLAAGEPAPRREPRLRIENQYGGIGFVGDLGSTGHLPVVGELTASVHLAPLLERARGHLEASWARDPGSAASTVIDGRLAERAGEGWTWTPDPGGAGASFPVDGAGLRRCYALGFVLRAPGPLTLELGLVGEAGRTSAPLRVRLEAAAPYAGVVEIDAQPALVRAVTVRLDDAPGAVLVHDLFVISYG